MVAATAREQFRTEGAAVNGEVPTLPGRLVAASSLLARRMFRWERSHGQRFTRSGGSRSAGRPGRERCGLVQVLSHPVVVDGHAADHHVLPSYYREALALEQPPGELAGLGE